MRLLEPVPEWRITLRQVIKHKWFTGTDYIPRCTSLGDMMYDKKELCESVLSYMKYNLKIKTKDTINAVVTNRCAYIYFFVYYFDNFFICLGGRAEAMTSSVICCCGLYETLSYLKKAELNIITRQSIPSQREII